MTNDGWSNKWPSGAGWFDKPKLEAKLKSPEDWLTHISDEDVLIEKILNEGWPKAPELTGLDFGTGERTVLTTFENGDIKHKIIKQTELYQIVPAASPLAIIKEHNLKSQGSNLADDQQYLYFQCEGCKDILDPHTKSFAKLQDHRAKAGWKVKWNLTGMGYKVYCEKCRDNCIMIEI